MTLRVRIGGAWKTVSKMWIRKSGVWKEVERASIYRTHGNPATTGWREFFKKGGSTPPPPPPPSPTPTPPPPVTISIAVSPPSANGTKVGPGLVTTNSVTATASGGTPPYTYTWSRGAWDTPSPPNITNPHGQTTAFSAQMPNYDSLSAKMKIYVKDSKGNANSKWVYATFNVVAPAGEPIP